MNLSSCFLSIFLVILNTAGLLAHPKFRYDPYCSSGRVDYPEYQIFVGQIPSSLAPEYLQNMLQHLTEKPVRFESYHAQNGYAFIVVESEEHRRQILSLSHRIFCGAEGYHIYRSPIDGRHALVFELPRHELNPNSQW